MRHETHRGLQIRAIRPVLASECVWLHGAVGRNGGLEGRVQFRRVPGRLLISLTSSAPLADSDAAARIGLGCDIDGKGSEDLARTNQSSVTYGS